MIIFVDRFVSNQFLIGIICKKLEKRFSTQRPRSIAQNEQRMHIGSLRHLCVFFLAFLCVTQFKNLNLRVLNILISYIVLNIKK
jgi:hypothetical protein